jgi:hypothetical protein
MCATQPTSWPVHNPDFFNVNHVSYIVLTLLVYNIS